MLALGCTGGRFKQPGAGGGGGFIKACLHLLGSWGWQGPKVNKVGAPGGCLTSSCPLPGGVILLGLVGLAM